MTQRAGHKQALTDLGVGNRKEKPGQGQTDKCLDIKESGARYSQPGWVLCFKLGEHTAETAKTAVSNKDYRHYRHGQHYGSLQ